MHLVFLETSGNQGYIFATNKLKENIGASELAFRAGSDWVIQAIQSLDPTGSPEIVADIRQYILSDSSNPPIERTNSTVEIIFATSGKALLLVNDEAQAKAIIAFVTRKALKEAPGLDIAGTYLQFDWKVNAIGDVSQQIHQQFDSIKAKRPPTQHRFLRLPVVESCTTSGMPASELLTYKDEKIPISTLSKAKRDAADPGLDRLAAIAARDGYQLFTSLDDLENIFESQLSWLSVIHADGNGLGEIILNFGKHLAKTPNYPTSNIGNQNRAYINALKQFSIALDICTEQAFIEALTVFPKDHEIPLVPIILGGDDLTVVCDGQYALPFTERFLLAFESQTQRELDAYHLGGIIPNFAREALKAPRLSACAGVAIIKPHFPFSVAYELAESLMQSAKTVKQAVTQPDRDAPYPCSALDFHCLYDTSNIELSHIRQKLEFEGDTPFQLYHRPYVVTDLDKLHDSKGKAWAKAHHWTDLTQKVKVLQKRNQDGDRILPSSQIHTLRNRMYQGIAQADAHYQLIRHRYSKDELRVLEGDERSLFIKSESPPTTALVDAIDAAKFMGGDHG